MWRGSDDDHIGDLMIDVILIRMNLVVTNKHFNKHVNKFEQNSFSSRMNDQKYFKMIDSSYLIILNNIS